MLDHILSSLPLKFSIYSREPIVNDTVDWNVTNPAMANLHGEDGNNIVSSQATLTPSHELENLRYVQNNGPSTSEPKHPEDAALLRDGQLDSNQASDMSFTEALSQYKDQKELEFVTFESKLSTQDTKTTEMEEMEWDDLQANYERAIGPMLARESEIMERFNKRFQVRQNIIYLDIATC